MDVSLVLKPFGATTVVASVEEALAKFIETEKLEVWILFLGPTVVVLM